jgi:tyrosinase
MVSTKLKFTALLVSLLSNLVSSTPVEKRGPDDDLAATALDNAYKVLNGTLKDGSTHTACTKDNVVVRRE